jgi:hypothetical protein
VHHVCHLAGSPGLLEDLRADLKADGVIAAISSRDSAKLYDWLINAFAYQGISDAVASRYMDDHGCITWRDVHEALAQSVSCPKLASYWHFHDCRYEKGRRTCAEPDHLQCCPLPHHDLRNGRLNQMAYSLFLFIRDGCRGDLVGWIDTRLRQASNPRGADRPARMREALLGPMRHIFGVSDKVLAMAISSILLGATRKPLWFEAGVSMIAIDTLVHNFLHRAGILSRFGASHAYGPACYQPAGCAGVIDQLSSAIDAREFNAAFPRTFPRFVQHAIWQFCAQAGLDRCNGNQINDARRCQNLGCELYFVCDRKRIN